MPRVLVLVSSLKVGGSERNVVQVLPHMAAAGAEAVLGSLSSTDDSFLAAEFARSGLPRVDLGADALFDRAAGSRLRRFVRRERIQVVHAQDQYSTVLAAWAFGPRQWRHWESGPAFLMTRHVMRETPDDWGASIKARLVLTSARYCADHVVAVSDAVRTRFARQAGVSPRRITAVHNGIDVEPFRSRFGTPMEARAALGWDPATPTITLIGVMRRDKGHDVLFEALPEIAVAVPRLAVRLAGSGELERSLRAQAGAAGLDQVEFLGSRDDIPAILAATDVLVLPSWTEALPTVLLEAGAAHVPVVATRVGGVPEIVEDGVTGMLVEPGDAPAFARGVISLLRDPGLAAKIGAAAFARVCDEFSLPTQAAATVGIYRSVLSSL